MKLTTKQLKLEDKPEDVGLEADSGPQYEELARRCMSGELYLVALERVAGRNGRWRFVVMDPKTFHLPEEQPVATLPQSSGAPR